MYWSGDPRTSAYAFCVAMFLSLAHAVRNLRDIE